MEDKLTLFLQESRKKTVSLGELEKLAGGETSYEDFAAQVNELVEQGVLKAISKHGFNQKLIPLANTYRIYKSRLLENSRTEIEKYQLLLDPRIRLDAYYALTAADWEKDLPFIQRLDNFLRTKGLPVHQAAAPERSYALVGDEKWIDEKGGRKVLERLGLWDELKIESRPNPLMLAVNQSVWDHTPCLHLVVENKTPYYALLDSLEDTNFLSLIYGAGWKITAGILMLEKQLGLQGREQRLFYFGDLDYEGISIWHALSDRRPVQPALEFYRALLARPCARGKENQQRNEAALTHFLSFFRPPERDQIIEVLNQGCYYPQEGLNRIELQEIWRQGPWNWT